jgi:hypothetical protein
MDTTGATDPWDWPLVPKPPYLDAVHQCLEPLILAILAAHRLRVDLQGQIGIGVPQLGHHDRRVSPIAYSSDANVRRRPCGVSRGSSPSSSRSYAGSTALAITRARILEGFCSCAGASASSGQDSDASRLGPGGGRAARPEAPCAHGLATPPPPLSSQGCCSCLCQGRLRPLRAVRTVRSGLTATSPPSLTCAPFRYRARSRDRFGGAISSAADPDRPAQCSGEAGGVCRLNDELDAESARGVPQQPPLRPEA